MSMTGTKVAFNQWNSVGARLSRTTTGCTTGMEVAIEHDLAKQHAGTTSDVAIEDSLIRASPARGGVRARLQTGTSTTSEESYGSNLGFLVGRGTTGVGYKYRYAARKGRVDTGHGAGTAREPRQAVRYGCVVHEPVRVRVRVWLANSAQDALDAHEVAWPDTHGADVRLDKPGPLGCATTSCDLCESVGPTRVKAGSSPYEEGLRVTETPWRS
ncbi:hypothetical protein B0H13DRAFT_1873066 [Mycena leptocephala]|nr:hypothetical protein B0H13DRAFT_1873066 [Mycena leptocephala]